MWGFAKTGESIHLLVNIMNFLQTALFYSELLKSVSKKPYKAEGQSV